MKPASRARGPVGSMVISLSVSSGHASATTRFGLWYRCGEHGPAGFHVAAHHQRPNRSCIANELDVGAVEAIAKEIVKCTIRQAIGVWEMDCDQSCKAT